MYDIENSVNGLCNAL